MSWAYLSIFVSELERSPGSIDIKLGFQLQPLLLFLIKITIAEKGLERTLFVLMIIFLPGLLICSSLFEKDEKAFFIFIPITFLI